MNPEPLISIALCTYNGSRFIREQLNSILNQEYSNYEIVIVDDNSTDDTVQIVLEYLPNTKIRLFFNEVNLGYAANFEKAMSLCHGEYISLSDQDDIWKPEKLKLLASKMNGMSGVYHDSAFITESGEATGFKLTDKVHFVSGKVPESLLLYNYIAGHTMMIKRQVLATALPIPKGIYHDWWLAFVCMNLDGLDYIEEPLVYYRIHSSNQTVLADEKRKISHTDNTSLRIYKKTRKLAETLQVLRAFHGANFINDALKGKIGQLIELERSRLVHKYSLKLFYFLLRNIAIYKSGHRGYFGKVNAMRKDSRGVA